MSNTKPGFFERTFRFFPFQLLLLHFKKSQIQLFLWLILVAFVSGKLAQKYGVYYLFVSPEYLDKTELWSYILMGMSFGLFTMAFHISSYVRYSFRFPFIATLSRAFYKFSLNNSLIPALFAAYYIYALVDFHIRVTGKSWIDISFFVLGFLLGAVFIISLTLTYFFTANRNLVQGLGEKLDKPLKFLVKKNKRDIPIFGIEAGKTRTYMRSLFQFALVRKSDHYKTETLIQTFQQHHRNAAFYTVAIIVLLIVLSIYQEVPRLMIPAGSTIFILASIYMLLTAALFTWFKGWTTSVMILLLIGLNFLTGTFPFNRTNFAYGLDYKTEPAPFTYEHLDSLTQFDYLIEDKQHMLQILGNWKAKQSARKPKLVFINTSGGGLRSALWTFDVLQYADSLTHGKMMDAAQLITGSSGGMVGAAYYRELVGQRNQGQIKSSFDDSLRYPLARDLLNPVAFSFATNDLFIKFRTFEDAGFKYTKDRGYAWESKLIENTGVWRQTRISDYAEPEFKAEIPLMILAPSIVNEGRRLLISAQPTSYLSVVYPFTGDRSNSSYDGVEFKRMFEDQSGDSLKFTSALRMSASFPYITPLVSLPSDPPMRLIDAGVRDNSGFELSVRFLYCFKEWIRENTSGVVFLQVHADRPRMIPIQDPGPDRALKDISLPIAGVFNSFINMQDFQNEYLRELMNEWLDMPVDFLNFELMEKSNEFSLSWHLTEKEKSRIYSSIYNPTNWESFNELKRILEEN